MRSSVRFPILVAALAIAAPSASARFGACDCHTPTSGCWNPPRGSSRTTAETRRKLGRAAAQIPIGAKRHTSLTRR